MVLRHLCRPRDPCGAEIKAGAVSINDALALSIAELDRSRFSGKISNKDGQMQRSVIDGAHLLPIDGEIRSFTNRLAITPRSNGARLEPQTLQPGAKSAVCQPE